ncbi:MAG: sensor histidine kinase [Lachnospiraceae bacterium]|nr:sensor histidine kinase [Lachnospiraceae bacterium]
MKNRNEKSSIETIYANYLKEKRELEYLISHCMEEYEELKNHIIYEKNSYNELRIFSPRQNMRSEEEIIKESKEKCNELSEKINSYKRKLMEIEDNIRVIEQVKEKIDIQSGIEVLSMNENDRKRIARDLHDSTIQNLVYLIHKVEFASKFIEQDPIRAKLELSTITKNLKDIIQDVRELVYDLHPMNFEDLGFESTLTNFFDNLSHASDIEIFYEINMQCDQYDEIILITLFRIIQECCCNAIKHSKGKNIHVVMKEEKNVLLLIIQDDGTGFLEADLSDEKEKHFGLKILKERVSFLSGTCLLDSTKNGVTVRIEIPIIR